MEYCAIVQIYYAIIHINSGISRIIFIDLFFFILLHLLPQLGLLYVDSSFSISAEVLLILVILILQLLFLSFLSPCTLNLSLHLPLWLSTRVHASHFEYLLRIKILLQSLNVLLCQDKFAFFVQRLHLVQA